MHIRRLHASSANAATGSSTGNSNNDHSTSSYDRMISDLDELRISGPIGNHVKPPPSPPPSPLHSTAHRKRPTAAVTSLLPSPSLLQSQPQSQSQSKPSTPPSASLLSNSSHHRKKEEPRTSNSSSLCHYYPTEQDWLEASSSEFSAEELFAEPIISNHPYSSSSGSNNNNKNKPLMSGSNKEMFDWNESSESLDMTSTSYSTLSPTADKDEPLCSSTNNNTNNKSYVVRLLDTVKALPNLSRASSLNDDSETDILPPAPSLTAKPDAAPVTTTRPSSPPAAAPLPEIEVSPGVYKELRGSAETLRAVMIGTAATTECFLCNTLLFCVPDCEMVLCPDCRILSPLEDEDNNSNTNLNSSSMMHQSLPSTSSSWNVDYGLNGHRSFSHGFTPVVRHGVGLGLKTSMVFT